MTPDDVAKLIAGTGFPVFMCAWFMFRLERSITVLSNRVLLLLEKHSIESEDEKSNSQESKGR